MKIISTNIKTSLRNRFEIRLDNETAQELEYCANKLNTTKTNIVKQGIKKVKEDIKK